MGDRIFGFRIGIDQITRLIMKIERQRGVAKTDNPLFLRREERM